MRKNGVTGIKKSPERETMAQVNTGCKRYTIFYSTKILFIGHRLRSYFRLPLLFFESDPIISYSNHSSLNLSLFTCGSNA